MTRGASAYFAAGREYHEARSAMPMLMAISLLLGDHDFCVPTKLNRGHITEAKRPWASSPGGARNIAAI